MGEWKSLDLMQDELDSTCGPAPCPERATANQAHDDVRFVVQAANGAGAVGLDTAEGDGYPVADFGDLDTSKVVLGQVTPDDDAPLGVMATVTDSLGNATADRRVVFEVIQNSQILYGFTGQTDEDGHVALGSPPGGGALPVGAFRVKAYIFDAQEAVTDTAVLDVDTARLTAAADATASPFGVAATVVDIGNQPWVGRRSGGRSCVTGRLSTRRR